MATNASWTVVFDDKIIIKNNGPESGTGYTVEDNDFWGLAKWSNIWAIQYKHDDHDYNDTVEHRDDTPHSTWTESGLGDFRDQFVTKWDAAHLSKLQADWDADVIITYNDDGSVASTESEADQIARKGERPSSYSSY